MAKTVDQKNQEQMETQQAQVDDIQEQRQSAGLAAMLANDRKTRGVLNKTAGDFAEVNDTINVLARQLEADNAPKKTQAQKVRAFNITRDSRIRETEGLDQEAPIPQALIKEDNDKLRKTAEEQGISIKALKAVMQDKRDEATNKALLKATEELLSITEQAETASVRDQKKLLKQTNTQIKILMEVEGQTDPEESPVLKQALETQKLLQSNTTMLKQTGEMIGDQIMTGLGAMVGVLGDSPALALGAQFIQTKFNERKEAKKEEVAAVRKAQREKSDREIQDLTEIQASEPVEKETSAPAKKPTTVARVKAKVADVANTLTGKESDPQEGVINAVVRVEDKLNEGLIQAENQFKKQQRDAIEARRDAKGGTGFSKRKIEEPEEDDGLFSGLMGAILGSNFISFVADKLRLAAKWVLTSLFSKKALSFMLKKALPIAAIGGMIYSGFNAGMKSFEENGDIALAIGDGAAGIVEAITFGFLKAETIKDFGSMLGMEIEDGISLWKLQLENALAVPIDNLKQFGADLAEWFSPLTDLDVRDFLPDSMTNWMEKTGIIDTREEKAAKQRVEEFDEEAEAALQARVKGKSLSDAEVEVVRQSITVKLQERADAAGVSLEELKSELQKRKQQMPTQPVPKSNVIPMDYARMARQDKAGQTSQLQSPSQSHKQIADLNTVIEEKRVIETRKANEAEAEKRKAQQPAVINQTSNTQNNSQVNVQTGGPSDDDHMYNRSENQQRVG